MMTQADIDKLVDELIDAEDRYEEIVTALGLQMFDVDGAPLVSHAEVVARAKELAAMKAELAELRAQYNTLLGKSFALKLDVLEVAKELGCADCDPISAIIARAKELAAMKGAA